MTATLASPTSDLRIALLLASLGRGGTETQAISLARGLAARGCSVDLFVMYGDEATLLHWEDDVQRAALLRFGRDDHTGRLRAVTRGAVSLHSRLTAGSYDVVHSALARAYVVAPLLAPLRHRPRLIAWRRELASARDRTCLANAAERWSARRTDALVANSAAVAQIVAERERVARQKITVIHNHLPQRAFEHLPQRAFELSDRPSEHGELHIVSVANLLRVKRLDLLIEALRRLRERGLAVSATFVGEGPERASLQQQADDCGVPVTFTGSVTDPRPWLASAAVFVQSSDSEGLSNSLLEAMAQGKPVVATSVGGTEEALGDTGLLIPSGNPEAMATAIERLLDDQDLAQSLARRARARAQAQFSLDESVNRHLAVYVGA